MSTTTQLDPVQAAQVAVRKHLERLYGITVNEEQCVIVEVGLKAVVAAGWRFVRTGPVPPDVVKVVESSGQEWVVPVDGDVVRLVDEWRGP